MFNVGDRVKLNARGQRRIRTNWSHTPKRMAFYFSILTIRGTSGGITLVHIPVGIDLGYTVPEDRISRLSTDSLELANA